MTEKDFIIVIIKNILLRIKGVELDFNEGSLTDYDIDYIFFLLDSL